MEQKDYDFFSRLLEQLHQAEKDGLGNRNISLTYVASGAQNIGSVHSQSNHYQGIPVDRPVVQQTTETPTPIPSPKVMAHAVESAMTRGYWWANTAWAVVYRIYQIKGYNGGFSQFVKDTATWPRSRPWLSECNFDAVQKLVSSGRLSGSPETWKYNGAQEQAVRLASLLLAEMKED